MCQPHWRTRIEVCVPVAGCSSSISGSAHAAAAVVVLWDLAMSTGGSAGWTGVDVLDVARTTFDDVGARRGPWRSGVPLLRIERATSLIKTGRLPLLDKIREAIGQFLDEALLLTVSQHDDHGVVIRH